MRALISVYDKTGVADFARGLAELGWEIVASGGTAAHLQEHGIEVTPVESLTGFVAHSVNNPLQALLGTIELEMESSAGPNPALQRILADPGEFTEAFMWLWNGPSVKTPLRIPPTSDLLTRILMLVGPARHAGKGTAGLTALRAAVRAGLSAKDYSVFRRCLEGKEDSMGAAIRRPRAQGSSATGSAPESCSALSAGSAAGFGSGSGSGPAQASSSSSSSASSRPCCVSSTPRAGSTCSSRRS